MSVKPKDITLCDEYHFTLVQDKKEQKIMMIDRGDRDVCVALTTNVKLCEDHFRVVDTLLVLKKKKEKNMMLV